MRQREEREVGTIIAVGPHESLIMHVAFSLKDDP